MTRYVLYGGKGGVGKTTCAAATGLALAERGERTLVVSTDPAHSLGDALAADLDGTPREVEADLWAVEADPESGQAAYERVVRSLAAEFRRAGVHLDDEDVDRLFAAGLVPGSDEIAGLEHLATADDRFERVVLDTAPTGHTLRLLALPDVLDESLSTAQSVASDVRRLVSSARSMVVGPAAFLRGDGEDEEIAALRERMRRVRALLRDTDRTDFRVVLTPESLAVAETRRLVDRLRSFDVPVGTLVVNRAVEEPDGCERCRERARSHRAVLDDLERAFPALDRVVLPDAGAEIRGRDGHERLGRRLVE